MGIVPILAIISTASLCKMGPVENQNCEQICLYYISTFNDASFTPIILASSQTKVEQGVSGFATGKDELMWCDMWSTANVAQRRVLAPGQLAICEVFPLRA